MPAGDDLAATAARLSGAAGRGRPVALQRLGGGKNNRVYRVDLADGTPLVLKSYYADARDPRDRLGAEWSFLTYAWGRQVRTIPEPLACERQTHSGLYGFLPGRKLAAGDVQDLHVRAAADFICAVNAAPRDPQRLAPGSEACFTVAAHVAAVDRRVARLAELDPQAPVRDEAERLVQGRLLPAWRAVQATILREAKALGLDAEAEIRPSEQCISPSDFGFHNALLDGERIGFIDFEYAGRDDPAKLVCDFFCQPEVPVPPAHYEPFVARIVTGLGLDDIHRARCGLLLDAYRIKWICIMLNEFLPADAARRAFADPGARAGRCAAQLAKAAASMARVEAA